LAWRGSSWAATGGRKGREGGGQNVTDRERLNRQKGPTIWAFTTIYHHLLSTALTRGRSGTDRGRQTASQRIPGGLVSHWQEKARPAGVAGSQGGLFLVGDPVS
jgi:hypothetical protein